MAPAVAFLRGLREALDAGVDLPAALARGAGALPRDARDALSRAARRLEGDYTEDEWGFDEEFAETVFPLFEFMYDRWWRVQVERPARTCPSHGRALLAANHAGIVPWDATMMGVAILREHPLPRYPRFLVLNWAFDLPYVSFFMRKVGGVVASPYNAARLLEQDELVAVFPEGVKGAGKAFRDRYRLQRFGRGGFVEIALRTGAPIVPVAVVGSEEIYPKVGEAPAAGPPARRALLPAHAHLPLARPARRACRCRPSGGSSSASRSRPRPTGPRRPTTARSSSSCPSECRDTIQEKVYENLVKRGSAFV